MGYQSSILQIICLVMDFISGKKIGCPIKIVYLQVDMASVEKLMSQ